MSDAELREFCNQMIGKFKALSELQKEMQYETIDTRFTEWELKKLIFALDVLRIKAEQTEPKRGEWIGDKCSVCGEERSWYGSQPNFCPDCGADMRAEQTEPQEDCRRRKYYITDSGYITSRVTERGESDEKPL